MIHEHDKARWVEQVLISFYEMRDADGRVPYISADMKLEILRATEAAVLNMQNDSSALFHRFSQDQPHV